MKGIKSKNNPRIRSNFSRTEGNRLSLPIIHIICEGKTEVNYIKHLIKPYRLTNIQVNQAEYSDPVSMVQQAKQQMKIKPEIDCVYCVYDGDKTEACRKASEDIEKYNEGSELKLFAIVSTPCFEIWPLFHFGYTTKPYKSINKGKSAADQVISDLKKYLPGYHKTSTDWYAPLKDKLDQAIENARKIREHNEASADKDRTNTSTNMHELVLKIQELDQQQKQRLKTKF